MEVLRRVSVRRLVVFTLVVLLIGAGTLPAELAQEW
jgi:hypothetical protein